MPNPTDETSANWVEAQQNSYADLFPGDIIINDRSSFWRDIRIFREYMNSVVKKDVPAPVYLSGTDAICGDLLEKLSKREIEKGDVVSIFDRSPLKRSAETRDNTQQPNSKKSKLMSKDTTSTESTDSSAL